MSNPKPDREAAIAVASELIELGAPTSVITLQLRRRFGYSRAQAYRISALAFEQHGAEGISARPNGEELIAMVQLHLAHALADASLEGDHKVTARLAKELRESLKANGSITECRPPAVDEQVQAAQRIASM